MSNDKISVRQLLVLIFAALLSPAIQALPGQTAELAGTGAWLSALFAIPAALILCLVLFSLLRSAPEGGGLAGAFQCVLGKPLGNFLTAAYLIWGEILLCASVRRCALRFLSTSYQNHSLPLFILVLLGAALWMGRGRLTAFVRTGEIFYLALSIALGLVLFFGLFQLEPRHVLPLWIQDIPAAAGASLPVLGVMGYGIFGAFLAGGAGPQEGDRQRCFAWSAAFCGTITLLQLVCLGNFGPELVSRMDAPFFMMVKGIGVRGAFERVESVIIALWVLSDLLLLGLLVFACRAMAARVFQMAEEGKGAVLPLVIAALAGAFFLFPDAFLLSEMMEGLLIVGNLVFGFGVPLLIWGIGAARGKLKKFQKRS